MTVESASLAQLGQLPDSLLCFGRHLNECFELDSLAPRFWPDCFWREIKYGNN